MSAIQDNANDASSYHIKRNLSLTCSFRSACFLGRTDFREMRIVSVSSESFDLIAAISMPIILPAGSEFQLIGATPLGATGPFSPLLFQ